MRKASTILKERLKTVRKNIQNKQKEEEFDIKDRISQLKHRIFNVEEDYKKFGGIAIYNKLSIMKKELKLLEEGNGRKI